jgi:putative ABC transport system permease protein
MVFKRIFSTSRPSRAASLLIGVLMALTMAVLCNATFIVHRGMAAMPRPSGTEEAALLAVSSARVIGNIQTLGEARHDAYRVDGVAAAALTTLSIMLTGITAFGIIGATSYWVTQRRRAIGTLRALGATRFAVVRDFQVGNLLIAGAGTLPGIALAVIVNSWMVQRFAMQRLPLVYLLGGGAFTLLLGQLAVLGPAMRAAQQDLGNPD